MSVRTWVLSILVLGSTFFLLFCGPGPRPGELVKADRLMQDKQAKTRAAQAAPQVFQFAERYYKLAEEAYDDGEAEECIYYSTLAAIKFSTALEHARRLAAEDRLAKAEQRIEAAKKVEQEQQALRADYENRIKRMKKILALQANAAELEKAKAEARRKLEEEKKVAEARLQAERAKQEEMKKAQQVQELLAQAQSNIQAADALEASKYDPMNMNSAKTYLKQAGKALDEKRFKDATDLAKMATTKAEAATAKAKAEYAKKKKEAELLKERENLFRDAIAIPGVQAKQEKRGVVLTLHEMFASRKAVVLPERTYLLDKIAALAKKYPDYPIVVEGYTDSRGRDADNLALSQGRAQSVRDYLIQQEKLEFERIKSSGYGEANPVADNSRAAGRAKNRRVEVIFLFR